MFIVEHFLKWKLFKKEVTLKIDLSISVNGLVFCVNKTKSANTKGLLEQLFRNLQFGKKKKSIHESQWKICQNDDFEDFNDSYNSVDFDDFDDFDELDK